MKTLMYPGKEWPDKKQSDKSSSSVCAVIYTFSPRVVETMIILVPPTTTNTPQRLLKQRHTAATDSDHDITLEQWNSRSPTP